MGTVALMGGDEFLPRCVPMDRRLLERIAHRPPRVAIIPTAAFYENPRMAADNGVTYFEGLCAEAAAAMIIDRAAADDPRQAARFSTLTLDMVYLTGGSPLYLFNCLRDSAVWSAIRQFYYQGGMLVGSSAGAMVLGEIMNTTTAWWVDALGLLEGVAVLPHHEPLRDVHSVQDLRDAVPSHIVVLGIQAATACVNYGDKVWRVVGAGSGSVYADGSTGHYRLGESFELP
ncbi:MAG: Type 1 glutamine amidotransferase-like domain-containing protein [Chloroflexi bacterium]|nr:Type 1 glutamine amidotransferase-like domain-containing protein [Chloroflexota bacterium]